MVAAKKQTKQDLEKKIVALEAKLNRLSEQITSKSAKTKPAEVKLAETAKPKPAETAKPKPAEVKPAETAKPEPALPKGSTPKPQEAPKPAETKSTAPTTMQYALENA